MRPTARRELVLVPHHAGGDTVDVGNVGAAKTKRIVGAGRLLLGGVGLARCRQHRNRKRRCEHQAELETPEPNDKHDSPRKPLRCEVWVSGSGLARDCRVWESGRSQPVVEKQRIRFDLECHDIG
jgi:hypothetical protein